jgi:Plasmid encoded RepA protein
MADGKLDLRGGRNLEVAYIPRFMANVALPVRDTGIDQYSRRNGRYELIINPLSTFGLPFGTYARLLMCHIATEVKLTSDHQVFMGETISSFIRSLDKMPSGGDNGTIGPLKDQLCRLLSSKFIWRDYVSVESVNVNFRVPRSHEQCWYYTGEHDWPSYLTLENSFFLDLSKHAVPVKWKTLSALSNKPLAFDLYCWLTYRFHSLSRKTEISWEKLQDQFGSDITEISNFRRKMKKAMWQVQELYPEANVEVTKNGLWLFRSKPQVPIVRNVG